MLRAKRSLSFFLLFSILTANGVCAAAGENGNATIPENAAGSIPELNQKPDQQPSEEGPGNEPNALDLALKTITLSQGEGGLELWRLKAEWANIQKENDQIFLIKPRLTYFMEDGKILYVESDTGDVDQKNQILRFIDTVRITQEDKLLTGNLLVYNGTAKTMTMPLGAELTATGVDGRGNRLVWHIDTKIIETTGDILVHMESAAPDVNITPPKIEDVIVDEIPESGQETSSG